MQRVVVRRLFLSWFSCPVDIVTVVFSVDVAIVLVVLVNVVVDVLVLFAGGRVAGQVAFYDSEGGDKKDRLLLTKDSVVTIVGESQFCVASSSASNADKMVCDALSSTERGQWMNAIMHNIIALRPPAGTDIAHGTFTGTRGYSSQDLSGSPPRPQCRQRL